MATSVEITRGRLVEAAETLMAARGVDAVSLREINRASGARNAIAVQYHFGDRAGLVRAILDKHLPGIEARRHALLDQYEAAGAADVRQLAGALVRPWAAKLHDPDGGRELLGIYADLVNRPNPQIDLDPDDDQVSSLYRWRALLDPLLDADAVHLHRRFTAVLFATTELGRRARSEPHADDRLFTSYLVDTVAAILQGPVSEETSRLARERDRSRSARPSRRRAAGPTRRSA